MENDLYVLIPVFNEEETIGGVIQNLIDSSIVGVDKILIIDNGSTDRSKEMIQSFQVHYLLEEKRGYGAACLSGIQYLAKLKNPPQFLLIMDGDGSDHLEDIPRLINELNTHNLDLIIGARYGEGVQQNSLHPLQVFGNKLTCLLIQIFFGRKFHDLGPLRLIRFPFLLKLNMNDKTWGWNIEMHIKALKMGKLGEIPVSYSPRKAGISKISGNLFMSIRVGTKILYTFFRNVI